MRSTVDRLKPALWIVGLSIALVSLVRSGKSLGPDLPPASFGDLQRWWNGAEPLTRVAELSRLGSILLIFYLLVVSAAQIVYARGHRSGSSRHAFASTVRRMTPRLLTTALASILMSAGPATASTAGDAGSAEASPRSDPPTMEQTTPGPQTRTSLPWANDNVAKSGADSSTMPGSTGGHPGITAPGSNTPNEAATAGGLNTTDSNTGKPNTSDPFVSQARSESEHVVSSGEHFWSIAERVVTECNGSARSEAQIAGFWVRLVETNRHKLVDPGNPDLILPGQILTIPDFP